MAPSTVGMVLVEGENADGVIVDRDDFDVDSAEGSAAERVAAAIMGTRDSAREGGYRLTSTGVTWTDQAEAAALREALVAHKIDNVMLISAFLAAVALTQTVGNLTHYLRTALLFIEPDTAMLAVVTSADGSIAELHHQPLTGDDDHAVAQLADMVAGVDRLPSRPDGVFVVGSGVNVAMIKPELDRVSPLPVSVAEEPETALARGAALASAHAPLFSSSTQALAWAQDPGTDALAAALASPGYAYVPAEPVDYSATDDHDALAYSAVPDDPASGCLPPWGESPGAVDDPQAVNSQLLAFTAGQGPRDRRPLLITGSVAALFVVGVVALAIALALSIRPKDETKPSATGNLIAPAHQVSPPKAPAPAPPSAAIHPPAPPPEAPPPAAPPPEAPAPAPPPPAGAPAPPPPPPGIPPIIPQLLIPGLTGPPGRGGWGGGDHGHGHDHDDDDDWGGGGIPIPIPIPGIHGKLGF